MVPEDEDPITIMAREEMLAESARYEALEGLPYNHVDLSKGVWNNLARSSEEPTVRRLCQMAVAGYRAQQVRRRRTAIMVGAWLAVALAAAALLVDKFL